MRMHGNRPSSSWIHRPFMRIKINGLSKQYTYISFTISACEPIFSPMTERWTSSLVEFLFSEDEGRWKKLWGQAKVRRKKCLLLLPFFPFPLSAFLQVHSIYSRYTLHATHTELAKRKRHSLSLLRSSLSPLTLQGSFSLFSLELGVYTFHFYASVIARRAR